MTNEADIKKLYQLLFEMALGNFNFQTGTIQTVVVLKMVQQLKEVAKQMQEILHQKEYRKPFFTYQTLSQATLLIDRKLKILDCNDLLLEMTDYAAEELINARFSKIIAPTSLPLWRQIVSTILKENNRDLHTFPLLWLTKKNKIIPIFCTITKLIHSQQIIINSITTNLQQLADDTRYYASLSNKSENTIIKKVENFIKENLHQKIPTTKQLATQFGTNECTLKALFRQHTSTTIYQFYTQERLKVAHDLITKTTEALQDIATLSGYNEYHSFYKAFKKQYKYTPRQLKRLATYDEAEIKI